MSLFDRLLRRAPAVPLSEAAAARLSVWRQNPAADPNRPLDAARVVVVDVESSGLDVERDRLIAIGAVAVTGGRIDLADSLDIVLRQDEVSDRDNILVHGIGGQAQRTGVLPVEALLAFLEYLGPDPLVAFHVAFDAAMIGRAMRQHIGLRFEPAWADLAYVAPALYPREARRLRGLDHWLEHFGIGNYARHSALADALATAELLLALRPALEARRAHRFADLRDLEREWRRMLHPVY